MRLTMRPIRRDLMDIESGAWGSIGNDLRREAMRSAPACKGSRSTTGSVQKEAENECP